MTALEQARALGMMAALGAALGGIYDLMGMMRRSRAGVGASDLLFGMLCALGYEAAGNGVEQGGFARAVGAYYSNEIALFHIEGEVVEHQLLVWRAGVEGL